MRRNGKVGERGDTGGSMPGSDEPFLSTTGASSRMGFLYQ
jgi:hypothetical protein